MFQLMRLNYACTWVILAVPSAMASDPLAAKIEAVIDGPDYKQAHWGLLVVDAKTGEPLYARNPDNLVAPASTTKLYSCAAALVAYGPDYKFQTPVYLRGELTKNGTLLGDLVLRASGDPSFGGRTTPDGKLAFKNHDHTYANSGLADTELTDTNPVAALDDLAKQIKTYGVKSVTGEVLIDDRLFAAARGTGSGPDSVTPVMVNDNVMDVLVTPAAKPGDPARVRVRPETSYFQVDAEVTTGSKSSGPSILVQSVGTRQFLVRGSVPADGKPQVRIFPVDDPTAFARTLFIEALRRQGVRIAAPVARAQSAALPRLDDYETLDKVAEYTSPPFRELTKVTLKVSHNLYASALPCLVAVKKGHRTLDDGLREQSKLLKELGVDVETISFAGGAGGANADRVTPRATIQLLRGLAKRPEWPAFKAGLPSLGVDGTLEGIVDEKSPARGKVYAKTGTLVWTDVMNGRPLLQSKALAGTMTTADGRELMFAMFVNNVPLPAGVGPSREGKVLGKLCEIIHEAKGK